MALNIKDPATEKLARELAALTGEKITHVVKAALQARLRAEARKREAPTRRQRVKRLLENAKRKSADRPVSDHDWLYDENGLPK